MRVIVERRGRITIPSEIRKALGIREGMELEVKIEKGAILLKPRRKISAKDLFGIAGEEKVELEEIETSTGVEFENTLH